MLIYSLVVSGRGRPAIAQPLYKDNCYVSGVGTKENEKGSPADGNVFLFTFTSYCVDRSAEGGRGLYSLILWWFSSVIPPT